MSDYRLFLINHLDHISGSAEFRAFDDECAQAFAERSARTGPMELWCGTRLVKRWPQSSVQAAATEEAREALLPDR